MEDLNQSNEEPVEPELDFECECCGSQEVAWSGCLGKLRHIKCRGCGMQSSRAA
jgi:hypothetical protein